MTGVGEYKFEDGIGLFVELSDQDLLSGIADVTSDGTRTFVRLPSDASLKGLRVTRIGEESNGVSIDALDQAMGKFEDALAGIEHLAAAVREKLSPDQVELQLSLSLSGTVGWIVAKSTAEGSIQLTLTWNGAPPVSAKAPAGS